jgi:site-specific recombinase XerD
MRSHTAFNRKLEKRYHAWMVAMHYAPDTQSMYRRSLSKFIRFLGDRSVVSVTHWDIREFIAHVSEGGASLDATYRHLSVIRLFYDFLNLGGLVSYVAARLVKLRRPRKNAGPFLSESQVERLLAATQTQRERAVVEFFYGTGCRLSEVTHLKVEDIDLTARTARVLGKFGKVRVVLLTKGAVEALQAYIGVRKVGFVFQQDMPMQKGCVAKRGNYWVGLWVDYSEPGPPYPRRVQNLGRSDLVPYETAKKNFDEHLDARKLVRPENNRPLSKMAVQTMLGHIGERAGLRNVGPHMIRRSFATHLYDHGASLEVIQALLGHTYLQTTARYTRLSTGRLVKSFERCHPREKLHGRVSQDGRQEAAQFRQGF